MAKADGLHSTSLSLPEDLYAILRKKSEQIGLPISRLVSWAIDNELDSAKPFYYPCEEPETIYVQYAYQDEAALIRNFLLRYPEGVTIDMIMLMRRSIGIPNRETLMLALRELLKSGTAFKSFTRPPGPYFKKHFPKDNLVWIRLRQTEKSLEAERKKLEFEQKRLEEKMNRLNHREAMMNPIQEEDDAEEQS